MNQETLWDIPPEVTCFDYTALNPGLLTRARLGPEEFDALLTSRSADLEIIVGDTVTIRSMLDALGEYREVGSPGPSIDVRSRLRLTDRDGSVVEIYIDRYGSIIMGDRTYRIDMEPAQNALLKTIHAEFKARAATHK